MGGKATKTVNKVYRGTVLELWCEIQPLLQEFCTRYEIAGSFRRGKDIIDDVDIVIIPVIGGMLSLSDEARALYNKVMSNNKRTHTVFETNDGPLQCDFYIAEEADWGAQLLTWTGSADFNIQLRSIAKRRNLKLNQYGLWKNEQRIAGSTEEDIFKELRLGYKFPPERNLKFSERGRR